MYLNVILVFFFCYFAEGSWIDFIKRNKCVLSDKKLSCKSLSDTTLDLNEIDQSIKELDVSSCGISTIKFSQKPLNIISLNLSNNSLTELGKDYFNSIPHLTRLDLSQNQLKKVDENAFNGMRLEFLNLSKTSYQYSHHLCYLDHLRTIDISFLDLLNLQCFNSINLTSLYARNSLNIESSIKNWLPELTNLRLLDFSSSNMVNLDAMNFKNMSLTHFIFANNSQINSSSLELFFANSSILSSLKCLVLSQNKLNQSNFDLAKILAEHNSSLSLEMLDISDNYFSQDLNEFLFGQKNLAKLKYFVARGNKFEVCNKRLTDKIIQNLEYLDIAHNQLKKSSCLYVLNNLKSLVHLDMSHNFLLSDQNETELEKIFLDSRNLTDINFSSNLFKTFVIRFSLNHTRINSIDFSNNSLERFRFQPFDVESDSYLENEKFYEKLDNTYDLVIESPIKIESDQRYIFVDSIDLSQNKFTVINIHHQFQSIENVLYLNFSNNPIIFVNGLSDEAALLPNISMNNDKLKKILCIDRLDLHSNLLERIPNMMHSCISNVNLENNQLVGPQHLILSNFTSYFLDELNLKNNRIEKINVGLSGQKYLSDFYTNKNSPVHYFFGEVNKSSKHHVLLDLRGNHEFKCNCHLYRTIHQFEYLNFLVDCKLNSQFNSNCELITDVTKTRQLNSKLKFSFILTCMLLIAISFSLIVFICSDMCKNFTYFDQIGAIARQKFNHLKKNQTSENIDVQYSKLVEEATVSTIEINS